MRTGVKFLWLMVALLASACAWAQNGTVTLNAFPSATVADGRSTLTISAEVRDSNGNLVPDGTAVIFETKLGEFRENVIKTQNGFARAVLQAGSIPGISVVRATCQRFSAFGQYEIQFFADKAALDTAKEYIEIFGEDSLLYSVQEKTMEASGRGKGAHLRYREVEIKADDLQVNVPTYEVRARKARVTIGKTTTEFDELYMKLNQRKGWGFAMADFPVVRTQGNGIVNVVTEDRRSRLWAVDLDQSGLHKRTETMDRNQLKFKDILGSLSMVEAKRATAYPHKTIQFHRANVKVGGQSVMKLPLFEMNVYTSSPIITEQFVNVSSNQLAVNYPYYLSLKPGETSLARFRWGNRYGTGVGAGSGMFIDYERHWNRGDEMEGAFTVGGIGRDDWGAGIRQFWMTPDRTSISAQIDVPAHQSIFANASVNKPFGSYTANLNVSHGTNLSGPSFVNDQANLTVEKDPVKIGKTGAKVFFGMTANEQRLSNDGGSTVQEAVGLQARFVSPYWRIDKRSGLNASYRIAQLTGTNVNVGLSHYATLNYDTTIGQGMALNVVYDFVEDGFTAPLLGRHRLSAESYFTKGHFRFSASATKTLDLDRLSLSSRMSYSFSNLWHLHYSYLWDKYEGEGFLNQTIILGYKLGLREVGLSYSQQTKRLGIEILGSSPY
ncbi:MAG: hypothetical protein KF857_03010 [Fimbriimonadaceae bacterium]|nr:hypothetical protein [Fimbriimonadaceae bacterium]